MSKFLDAALEYAARGWAVFPLAEGQKVPAVKGGFKVATTDPEQIKAAWGHRPNFNIGIATGEVSGGLIVIDIDVDPDKGEDGMERLRTWEITNGDLPETVCAETGRGGMHLLFKSDQPIGCSVNADYGIDIRGDGGYIVAPPSVHPNGRPYAWDNDPEDYEVAEADANTLAFIRSVQPNGGLKKKFELPNEIHGGERNDTLMRYACSMQSQGIDDALILASLEAANRLKCKPPLADSEIEGIVRSVCERYDKGDPKRRGDAAARKTVALMLNSRGGVIQSIENCGRAINGDPALAGRFYYDVRAYTRMVSPPVPWDVGGAKDRPISDADYCGLAAYMEREYGLMSKQKAIDAVVNVSMQNQRNPVAEWLDGLKWDGVPRVDTLLTVYLGAEPCDYNAAVMRLFMQGAVARAYEPGTKFDYMPVLIGRQGLGKSMFLRRLAHETAWYNDNLNTIEGDAAAEKLRGMWILEMAELLATKRQKDVEGIKAFITSTVDTIRPKYARETEQRPRACVFCGTTNDSAFLTDTTGNRRFLPVECGAVEPLAGLFDEGVDAEFGQAWAEAVHVYKTERPPLVLDGRLQGYALRKQEEYTEEDVRVGLVLEYMDGKLLASADPKCVRVCVQEIVEALPDMYSKQAGPALTNAMHKLVQTYAEGWVKYPNAGNKARCGTYGVQRCYVPTEAAVIAAQQRQK